MLRITFRYKDQYSRGEWSYQQGTFNSVKECIDWYGLEVDCYEYEILKIEEI